MVSRLIDGLSIVVPCYEEEGNIERLAKDIEYALAVVAKEIRVECLWVDDGSRDATWQKIFKVSSMSIMIIHKGLKLGKNSGQSTALMAGIDHASHDWIVTIDGDCQNDPTDIVRMIELVENTNDVICGQRYKRKDKLVSRKLPSIVANWMARVLFRVEVRDLGCTLRLFNKKMLQGMRLIGEMHRTLTIFLKINGGILKEIPVKHRKRISGKSKYGAERIFKFICDLLFAKAYTMLRKTPLYLFTGIALVIALTPITSIMVLKFFVEDWKLLWMISILIWSTMLFISSCVMMGLVAEVNIRTHVELDRESQYNISDRVGIH